MSVLDPDGPGCSNRVSLHKNPAECDPAFFSLLAAANDSAGKGPPPVQVQERALRVTMAVAYRIAIYTMLCALSVAAEGQQGCRHVAARTRAGASATTATTKIGHLFEMYSNSLRTHPMRTQLLSSSLMGGVGDLSAQIIKRGPSSVDLHNTLAFAITGACFFGPWLYYWYGKMTEVGDRWRARGMSRARVVAQQVLVNQTLGALATNYLFFYILSFADDMSRGDFQGLSSSFARGRRAASERFWRVMIANWKFWPLMSVLNFAFVPPHFRAVFMGFVSVGWQLILALLSRA